MAMRKISHAEIWPQEVGRLATWKIDHTENKPHRKLATKNKWGD